jgi:alpha-ketoglutarate-dependent taurine dioxygenase
MTMQTRPLSPALGAEVLDFELPAEWTDEETAAVRAAFREHHLLLFREADLAPERQVALVRALGLAPDAWKDGKEYGLLSNTRPEAPNYGKHNPYLFHSDLTWKQTPIAAISLYALVLPEASSPTDFANAVHAAATIPAELHERFEGKEALFLIDFDGGDNRYSAETASPEAPRAQQLVLYPEPISGKESLIIDQLFMDIVVGWEREESEEARRVAHEHLYAPENVYRHEWQVGDLVVWNNLSLQHGRPQLPGTGERTHRRVSGSHAGIHHWEASHR